ncbi:MAG: hypothetical protein AAF799_25785 [Myxococcota bacterium]
MVRFDSDTVLTSTAEYSPQFGDSMSCDGSRFVHRVGSVVGLLEIVFEGTELVAGSRASAPDSAQPYTCTFIAG